jgi:hypothetical protein
LRLEDECVGAEGVEELYQATVIVIEIVVENAKKEEELNV